MARILHYVTNSPSALSALFSVRVAESDMQRGAAPKARLSEAPAEDLAHSPQAEEQAEELEVTVFLM